MKVGVLALQGDFREHLRAVERLGAQGVEVRRPEDLKDVERLIIPGGESTAISLLLRESGLDRELRRLGRAGLPIFGTCAGLILLARELVTGRDGVEPLGLIDIAVRRNAYGRQIDSFEEDLEIAGLGALRAVFIRAPKIERLGPNVQALAYHDGVPVLAREGNILVSSFHPELTGNLSLHRYFLSLGAEREVR
ncbi:MAG: pyridoxal 5'-phosphate synthase glutaminase subunit PdxT [Candidatus Acetothermia bacterium]|jgi:5'-phosphate synthase pdxT subunit|nr:pyridoxal 5'-phosphate synthase glutaminase subunit PdxT [Candidatus Acetothermia bacterium]MDH7505214.1 pyridoxal 5'-phosphate synthase glutaminase subunit PdxT [Candidatus Acetothermia bacterium]